MGSVRSRLAVATTVAAIAALLPAACNNGGSDVSGAGGTAVTTTTHPTAPPLPGETACTVVETTSIPEPDFNHIDVCTPLTYATNPPSGGNHWPYWAAFKKYPEAIPREMYVHDLEHGAIVLTYRCSDACPDVVAALASVFDGMADPLCLSIPGGPPARVVLTPDPDLVTPIAASAWGNTYTATCIDVPSLQAFANAHYGMGREVLCADGVDVEAEPPCGGRASGFPARQTVSKSSRPEHPCFLPASAVVFETRRSRRQRRGRPPPRAEPARASPRALAGVLVSRRRASS